MATVEPTLAALPDPVARYFLATRPPFLSVTLFAALIGLGAASYDQQFHSAATAIVTVLFALVAHAGINVLNDYYDALNGTDALNTGRIFTPAVRASSRTACCRSPRPAGSAHCS